MELDVAVEQAPAMCLAIARALGEAGYGAGHIQRLFREAVLVECVGCGIRLTADELTALLVRGEEQAEELPPRLKRLKLGYCARNGCDSRFYRITVASGRGIPWSRILNRALDLCGMPNPTPEEEEKPDPAARQVRLRKLAALASIALVLLLIILYQSRSRLPGLQPEVSPFQVDTNSLVE